MDKQSIFFSCVIMIVILNIFSWAETGEIEISKMGIGFLTGLFVEAMVLGAAMSISALTYSVDTYYIKFAMATLLFMNIFFNASTTMNVVQDGEVVSQTVSVGMGLLTNIYGMFDTGDWFYIGKTFTLVLGFLTYLTGMMIISE